MNEGIIQNLVEALDEEIQSLSVFIYNGSCATYDEYKHKTGIIRGLESSKNIIQDEVSKIANLQNTD